MKFNRSSTFSQDRPLAAKDRPLSAKDRSLSAQIVYFWDRPLYFLKIVHFASIIIYNTILMVKTSKAMMGISEDNEVAEVKLIGTYVINSEPIPASIIR